MTRWPWRRRPVRSSVSVQIEERLTSRPSGLDTDDEPILKTSVLLSAILRIVRATSRE